MKTNTTVTIINPFSGATVEKRIAEILPYFKGYCWPENVISELSGMCDTDEEWIIRAVEMMGPEDAGTVIIGS